MGRLTTFAHRVLSKCPQRQLILSTMLILCLIVRTRGYCGRPQLQTRTIECGWRFTQQSRDCSSMMAAISVPHIPALTGKFISRKPVFAWSRSDFLMAPTMQTFPRPFYVPARLTCKRLSTASVRARQTGVRPNRDRIRQDHGYGDHAIMPAERDRGRCRMRYRIFFEGRIEPWIENGKFQSTRSGLT